MSKTKYIIVTGGVCSGLGKGITSASIGALLKSAGYKVFIQKFDGYLNVDPGTMSPFQHGEVFVLDDGTETDLDLGHYERFIDENLNKLSSITSGKLYAEILENERKGKFLGGTVQVVPHLTNLVKEKVRMAGKTSGADFVIVEVGGTVGDIESEYILEAMRQMRREEGSDGIIFVHVSLLPALDSSHELKTKPTQSSVRELRRIGIQPDFIVARSDISIPVALLKKIALFCDVDEEAVVPAPTIKSIYEVPLNFAKGQRLIQQLAKKFKMRYRKPALGPWKALVRRIHAKNKKTVHIGIVAKYGVDQGDTYLSVVEALKSASYANKVNLNLEWVDSEKLENGDKVELGRLKKIDGFLVPGGFGKRGIEGKIMAAKYARENKIPYFGLCLGMQILTIDFARNVLKLENANSTEFDEETAHPVIHIMSDQEKKLLDQNYGATMRLGAWDCILQPKSLALKAYGVEKISERHRHRFEFNNQYREELENHGLRIGGTSTDGKLVEIAEVVDHPWMLGVQFHPEFKSRPLRAHPLFRDFIKACIKKNK